jgi:hypothetical protein
LFTSAFLGATALPVYLVFWMPEILNVALVTVAYFLWTYRHVAPGRAERRLALIAASRAPWPRHVLETAAQRILIGRQCSTRGGGGIGRTASSWASWRWRLLDWGFAFNGRSVRRIQLSGRRPSNFYGSFRSTVRLTPGTDRPIRSRPTATFQAEMLTSRGMAGPDSHATRVLPRRSPLRIHSPTSFLRRGDPRVADVEGASRLVAWRSPSSHLPRPPPQRSCSAVHMERWGRPDGQPVPAQ